MSFLYLAPFSFLEANKKLSGKWFIWLGSLGGEPNDHPSETQALMPWNIQAPYNVAPLLKV